MVETFRRSFVHPVRRPRRPVDLERYYRYRAPRVRRRAPDTPDRSDLTAVLDAGGKARRRFSPQPRRPPPKRARRQPRGRHDSRGAWRPSCRHHRVRRRAPGSRCRSGMQTVPASPGALAGSGLAARPRPLYQDRVRRAAGQPGGDGCNCGDAVESTHSPAGGSRRHRHQRGVRFEQRCDPESQRFGDIPATVFERQDRSAQRTFVRAKRAYRHARRPLRRPAPGKFRGRTSCTRRHRWHRNPRIAAETADRSRLESTRPTLTTSAACSKVKRLRVRLRLRRSPRRAKRRDRLDIPYPRSRRATSRRRRLPRLPTEYFRRLVHRRR